MHFTVTVSTALLFSIHKLMFCVSECSVGTYLSNETIECVPCFEGCNTATGCAGPLPFLDKENGCLDCDRVVLNRDGAQVLEW